MMIGRGTAVLAVGLGLVAGACGHDGASPRTSSIFYDMAEVTKGIAQNNDGDAVTASSVTGYIGQEDEVLPQLHQLDQVIPADAVCRRVQKYWRLKDRGVVTLIFTTDNVSVIETATNSDGFFIDEASVAADPNTQLAKLGTHDRSGYQYSRSAQEYGWAGRFVYTDNRQLGFLAVGNLNVDGNNWTVVGAVTSNLDLDGSGDAIVVGAVEACQTAAPK